MRCDFSFAPVFEFWRLLPEGPLVSAPALRHGDGDRARPLHRAGLGQVDRLPAGGLGVAGRVIFMDRGEIVETAPSRELFETPRLERTRAFLGHVAAR